LHLFSYVVETGEAKFYWAWETAQNSKFGWTVLTGKVDAENNNRFDLKTSKGNNIILLINGKDKVTLRNHFGYDGDLKKIGILPVGQLKRKTYSRRKEKLS